MQNIPSHVKSIRMMFVPSTGETKVEMKNNYYDLSAWDEVKTDNVGFKLVRNVAVGDVISGDRIVEIKHMPYNIYRVYVE